MYKLISVSITILILSMMAVAQPPIEFVHTYNNGGTDSFDDVYAASDGGYIMCGRTARVEFRDWDILVVRVDGDGEQIWMESFGVEQSSSEAKSIIEADNGDFLIGGSVEGNFTALLINGDGELIWQTNYGDGKCWAGIELKSGEFLLAGESATHGQIIMIDGDGEVLWRRTYQNREINLSEYYHVFSGIRETENGAVAAGYLGRKLWAVKVDLENGDIIWSNNYVNLDDAYCFGMTSTDDGGFVIAPRATGNPNKFRLLKINGDGQRVWYREYEDDDEIYAQYLYNVERADNGGFMLVGHLAPERGVRYAKVIHTNSLGIERWRQIYNMEDWEGFAGNSVINGGTRGHDNSVIAVGGAWMENQGNGIDALLMKLEPLLLGPVIFEWTPEDTILTVLQGDTIQFEVHARNQLGIEMSYLWIGIEDDSIGTDTTVTVIFDELGETEVQCQVTDGEFTAAITWHVTVAEFMISSHSPRNLDWTVRRPHEIEFSIGVRAADGVEPSYRWMLTDRENRRVEIGDESETAYTFDLRGNYIVEGIASHEDAEQSILWTIEVNSVLYWWTPHERQIEVEVHQQVEFSVIPFDPESPRLEFLWLVDGEVEEDVEDDILYTFDSVGNYEVTAIVRDRARVDTVLWTVTVIDPDAVDDDPESLLPTKVTLYAAAPNPFNSTTSIRYFLPDQANVQLTVYNSAGRYVQSLNDGLMATGEHQTILSGTDLSAGVYLLRLETDGVTQTLKIVLLK